MAEKQSNRDRLKEITDSIEKGIQELFQSEKYRQYLRTMSRFHKYSVNNTMLIYMQKPDATVVAGFNKWRDQFGRNVLKGEKGIKIIAPTPYKKKIEEAKLDPDTRLPMLDADGKAIMEEKEIRIPMYKPVTVFDVSQTEGKPLPQLAADLTGSVQNYEVFMEAVKRSAPVPVCMENMTGMDGYYDDENRRIAVRAGMSEAQTVCASIHEIAHLAVESFPRWCEFLSLNRPIVIPDMEAVKDTYPDEYQFFQHYGVKSVLAAPFSKRINQGYIAVDDPTRFQDDPTFLFIISYAVVVELNEIKLSQSIAAAQRASKYSDHDVYVNCLGDLEIRNAKGTLTEEDISSDLCLNLFALIITNMKRALKIERLAEALWPGDVMDNPYRSVSNIAYRLRRILSIIDLEDLVVGRHGTFVINPEYNVYTDFGRFEDNCRRMEAEANPKAQSEFYQGAVELYRGDLFSKISYQHWLMPKTAYYHSIFLRIIKCYIERKMEQGDYCAAHRAVVDAMSLDPYDSELNTDMILIMYHRGGAELAKSFLQTAEAYMSEEQITFVQQLWERK